MIQKIWSRKFSIIALICLMIFFWSAPEHLAVFVSGMLWGATLMGFGILHFFRVTKKMPYTWTCPRDDCCYHIEISEGGELFLLEMAEKHEHDHEMGHLDE